MSSACVVYSIPRMLPDRSALISSSAWCEVRPLRRPVTTLVISLAPLDSGATFAAFFGFFFIIDNFHLTHRETYDKNVLLLRLQLFNPTFQFFDCLTVFSNCGLGC